MCLDGVSVSAHDLSWLRRNIGVVYQDPTMFAGTVAENIAYARPHASRAEVEAAAAAANAHGWVSFYLSFYLFSYGQLD